MISLLTGPGQGRFLFVLAKGLIIGAELPLAPLRNGQSLNYILLSPFVKEKCLAITETENNLVIEFY